MRTFTLLLSLLFFSCSMGQTKTGKTFSNTIPDLVDSELEDSSFQIDSINKILNRISDRENGGLYSEKGDLRGLIIIEKNKIVLEENYNTFWRLSVTDIRSAGKSITSILLGIAMQEGLVQSLDQDVYSFFPKDKYPTINEDYKKIKIKHLLDMSSGLDADSNNSKSVGHVIHWMRKDDWKPYILSVPLTSTPGNKYVYSDIHALLIGAIIEETSGKSLRDFAKEKLFDPLGIQQFHWFTNVSNQTGAAGNLFLSTLDFAKLGLLISNQGKSKDKQILHPEYIKKLSNRTFDLSNDGFSKGYYYGMLWYKTSKIVGGKSIECIFASGAGGNHLVIIPDKEIVIAITSGAYGQRHSQRRSYGIWHKISQALK